MPGSLIHARVLAVILTTSAVVGLGSAVHDSVAISQTSQLPTWLGNNFVVFEFVLVLQAIASVILLGFVVYWSTRIARIAGMNRNYLLSALLLFGLGFIGFYLGKSLEFGVACFSESCFEGLAFSFIGYEGIILLVGLVLTLPLQLLLTRHR